MTGLGRRLEGNSREEFWESYEEVANMASMDAPTDHRGSEVLTSHECDRLLSTTPIGRVSFLLDGEPQILPVNYRFDDGSILIRTTVGSKIEAAEMHHRFAFEIDDWDAEAGSGWSVVAHGSGEVVNDPDEIQRMENLGLESWAQGQDNDLWIRLRLDDITGRRVG